jgi:peptidoglycan/xylan/chitin deacetylase (PgdA/CDA1 family)
MDPYNLDLPYLYDSFDWPHCDEQGYKLSASHWLQKNGKHGTPTTNGSDAVLRRLS